MRQLCFMLALVTNDVLVVNMKIKSLFGWLVLVCCERKVLLAGG
jgi:hypothetical protein